MSAPRITQFLPLRQLSSLTPHLPRHRRALHMTIPRDSTPILTTRTPIPRPVSSSPEPTTRTSTGRTFNTSRALKANNDSSTIDFAFLPSNMTSLAPGSDVGADTHLSRVPIIRADFARQNNQAEEDVQPVMRAVISSSSLDSLVSPMSEVSDNSAVEIDFEKVLEGVGSMAGEVVEGGRERVRGTVEEVKVKGEEGLGRVWRGFVDDVLGERKLA
ncbi:hypothetical protein BDZ85DRAFT_281303 [Elsinoe ampelina]|uniref:Uncharacterized protein n=1 Tax=Elsinoe ampelina TaxID=302913 RepID=A0A6A6GCU9_9PEZI|nr:hypothetical protein BDZ85DRAFT_281303 [Elsinoe ampelina]